MSMEAPMGSVDFQRTGDEASERAEIAKQTAQSLRRGIRILEFISKQSELNRGHITLNINELAFLTQGFMPSDVRSRLQESADAIEEAAEHQDELERAARGSAAFDLSRLASDPSYEDSSPL